ncbi:MAG: hypothetical protein ACOVT5_09870 [Armatimonadaceae bacterium]
MPARARAAITRTFHPLPIGALVGVLGFRTRFRFFAPDPFAHRRGYSSRTPGR